MENQIGWSFDKRVITLLEGRSSHDHEILYLLRPSTGEVIHRWNWRGKDVKVLSAENKIFVVVDSGPKYGSERAGDSNPSARLICLARERVIFDQQTSGFVTGLRWHRRTKELYESRIDGFGIIDGRSGMRKFEIKARDESLHPGIVDVRDGTIYLLSMKGVMYALRHPSTTRDNHRNGDSPANDLQR